MRKLPCLVLAPTFNLFALCMSVHPIEFWSRFFNHMLVILQALLTNFPLRKQALLKHPVLAKQPLASKVLSVLHVSHRPLGHIAAGTGRGYR